MPPTLSGLSPSGRTLRQIDTSAPAGVVPWRRSGAGTASSSWRLGDSWVGSVVDAAVQNPERGRDGWRGARPAAPSPLKRRAAPRLYVGGFRPPMPLTSAIRGRGRTLSNLPSSPAVISSRPPPTSPPRTGRRNATKAERLCGTQSGPRHACQSRTPTAT